MGKIVYLILGIIIGGLGGAMIAGPIVGGSAMGAGAATGLSAGICATVLAAEAEGFLTAEQVDQVLTRAAEDITGKVGVTADQPIVGGAAECETVMNNLKAAAAN